MDAPGGPAGDVISHQSEQGVLNASSSRRTASLASDKSAAARRNSERGGLDAGRQLLHKMYSFSSYSSSVHLYVEDDIDVGGDCGGTSDLAKCSGILCEGYDRDWEKQYASSVLASSEAESLQRMESCGSAVGAARRKISQEEKVCVRPAVLKFVKGFIRKSPFGCRCRKIMKIRRHGIRSIGGCTVC